MENQNQNENTIEKPRLKKKSGLFILAILFIIVLAIAAYVLGNMFTTQKDNLTSSGPEFVDSEQLPQSPPEAVGMVNKIENNSIFINERSSNDSLGLSDGGYVTLDDPNQIPDEISGETESGSVNLDFPEEDGNLIEIVITSNTNIFRDATMDSISFDSEEIERIEQKLDESSISEIPTQSYITVWGERFGDRIKASVILFMEAVGDEFMIR